MNDLDILNDFFNQHKMKKIGDEVRVKEKKMNL